jgi:hypothetical protein
MYTHTTVRILLLLYICYTTATKYIYYATPTINVSHTTVYYCYYVYTHAQSSCLCCYYTCLILLYTTAIICVSYYCILLLLYIHTIQPRTQMWGSELVALLPSLAVAYADVMHSDAALLRLLRYSVYLLYWYKSTNTDAEGAARRLPLCTTSMC